jgi:hypothetical protein
MHVEYVDGVEIDVTTIPKDITAWERQYQKPAAALANEPFLEWLLFIAYAALQRRDGLDVPFDDWMENVASVSTKGEEHSAPLARSRRTG